MRSCVNANEFVDGLEKGRVDFAEAKAPKGTGQAFFERILSYYGTSPAKLTRLGNKWRSLVFEVDDPAWVWRAGGVVCRTNGNWKESAQCFITAGAVARSAFERASFQVGAIDSLARSGKVSEAEQLAKNLYRKLKALKQPGLAARAMFNLGNALIYQDRMPEARKALETALPGLIEHGFELEAASAQMALSSTLLYDGDPRRAAMHARLAVGGAKRLSADYLISLADLNIALAHVVMNELEDARNLLLELESKLNDSPLDRSRVAEYLGDTYFKLNLPREALEYYQSASKTLKIPLHRAHLQMGIAECLQSIGVVEGAVAAFKRAAKLFRKAGAMGWYALCTTRFVQVPKSHRGRKTLFATLEDAAKGSSFHRLHVLLFQCEHGEDRFSEVFKIIRTNGYAGLLWRAHLLKAKASRSPGPHLRAAFQTIQLGRVGLTSVAARSSYLVDKIPAIQAYFDWLLADPTKSRIDELRDAIMQVRSVTLIDEILATRAVSPQVSKLLEEARNAIEFDSGGGASNGTRRGISTASSRKFESLATKALLELEVFSREMSFEKSQALMITETESAVYAVSPEKATKIPVGQAQLARQLKWLQYELLAPLTDPCAPAGSALMAVGRLRQRLSPMLEGESAFICPDRYTWQVPWSLLADDERALCLHPSMVGRTPNLSGLPNLVWLGDAPDLKFVEQEAERVSALLGNCRIIRSAKEARESLLGKYGLLHVVGHAHHQRECPSLSLIDFPDGRVFSYEITRSSVELELATLSACDTGTVSLAQQTEPDGLARAFISRGAAWVVASQWPLDDEAGLRLFEAFYDHFAKNLHVLEAVYHAKCITREWKAHPYYWGGLAAYAGLV